jgi:hypothetical protein
VRSSKTEPKITITVGAKTQAEFIRYQRLVYSKLVEYPQINFGEHAGNVSGILQTTIWPFEENAAIEAFLRQCYGMADSTVLAIQDISIRQITRIRDARSIINSAA